MQNLDKIIDKIMNDAHARDEKILLDAGITCDEIRAEADERAKTILLGSKNRARRDALATAERAYSTAEMKSREMVLATRVGLINKAFNTAYRQLLEMGDEEYCVFAAHLLADAATERLEAVKRLRKEYGDSEDCCADFEVLFREEDLEERAPVIIKTAKALMRKKSAALGRTPFTISEERARIDGGVILRYGDIETNCSVEAVINEVREQIEGRVAEILFSPDAASEDNTDDTDNDNEE